MIVFIIILTYMSIWISQYLLIKTTGLVTKLPVAKRKKWLATSLIFLMYLGFGLVANTPLKVGFFTYGLNLATVCLIVYVFREGQMTRAERFQLGFAASFNLVFYYGLSYIGDVILNYLPKGEQTFLSYASLMTVIMQLIFYFLLKRYNPHTIFQRITTNRVVVILISLVVVINLVIISISQYLIFAEMTRWENQQMVAETGAKLNYFVLVFLVDILISGLLIGGSSYVLFEVEKRQLQEKIILQQHFYIQNLEKMQIDMRVMRHDYKNILSGLIIQVEEGNMQGIHAYLEQTVTEFDNQIGKSLQQTTQLSKIEVVELKGLLLMKLVEMEHLAIDCQLEILTPVKDIQMGITDLVRCLGILLDNAIEEVKSTSHKKLNIIITQEVQDVSFMIKNAVTKRPLIQKIWQEGYSTKGAGRGLGLFSYQRIVEKYPNVLKETICEEQVFTQILKINHFTP